MKILVLAPAPNNISPSQRFRFEHYLGLKGNQEFEFVERSFFDLTTWRLLHQNNHFFQKAFGILKGFIKRFLLLFTLRRYAYVFIHREVAPIGPPVFEWLIAKIFKKKIIYDFDDAIWVSTASEANPKVAAIKCTWKVANICRMSHIISVGNDFLADYAKKYCKDVRVIPTVVNTDTRHNRIKNQDDDNPFVIGWTGTYTNFYNLKKIIPVITRLKEKYDFTFLIIANKNPTFEEIEYVYKKWQENSEIEDLLHLNIGVMPLAHTEIELGKCAFKAIQYMSLGIPAVVSPVGANCEVVQDKVTGLWADTEQQWYDDLELLIQNKPMRKEMGATSRKKIEAAYSVKSTAGLFFGLFLK